MSFSFHRAICLNARFEWLVFRQDFFQSRLPLPSQGVQKDPSFNHLFLKFMDPKFDQLLVRIYLKHKLSWKLPIRTLSQFTEWVKGEEDRGQALQNWRRNNFLTPERLWKACLNVSHPCLVFKKWENEDHALTSIPRILHLVTQFPILPSRRNYTSWVEK